ncbi:MAG: biopolymer transporter ExbD [Deltaproteobacteria bacterium]|jgi:biopolymer transport protein ExbD|nr:biopolymer transporter ExbD [Deltaproteobacteria bacterium]
MRFKKDREEETTLGIAPLIDIVFLLLIFFMVTSHFDIATGVRIRLPKVSTKIFSEENKNKITLVIDKSAQIYLEGKKIDQKTLQKKLQNLVNKGGIFHLILQADKDVPHGKVVQIMDLAKRAGVQSIIIAARWKSERIL